MDQEELDRKLEALKIEAKIPIEEIPLEEKLINTLENTVLMANRHYEDMKLIAHNAMAALMGSTNQTDLPPEMANEEPELENDPSIDGGEIGP